MAKFKDIDTGKKFYHTKTSNVRDKKTGKREPVLSIVYVIKKDEATRLVLASINKMPPKWFSPVDYRYWQKENPMESV